MVDEGQDGNATGAISSPPLRSPNHRHCEIKEAGELNEGVDSISSLPDEILQHILSFDFTPFDFVIRTSVLSRRWRHVWTDTHLSLKLCRLGPDSINKALARYTARKMMSFKLYVVWSSDLPYVDSWIQFAMSRNVENLSLCFWIPYNFPVFFFINSSIKQLTLDFSQSIDLNPICHLSWTSLKKLFLRKCNISDENIANILSGCPVLESLTLYYCFKLTFLDLSKSLRLKTLEITDRDLWGPMKIVAPHIHFLALRLTNKLSCTLVDVSSLFEAKLDIDFELQYKKLRLDFLQVMVLEMLEKLQNVANLTFRSSFLKILSLVELRHLPIPSFKVKDLTLVTTISQYVIPGIVRLPQNSPELRKLTLHTMNQGSIQGTSIDKNLRSHGLNSDQCWSSEARVFKNVPETDVESKVVVSFIEIMLKTTKTLKKIAYYLTLNGKIWKAVLILNLMILKNFFRWFQ